MQTYNAKARVQIKCSKVIATTQTVVIGVAPRRYSKGHNFNAASGGNRKSLDLREGYPANRITNRRLVFQKNFWKDNKNTQAQWNWSGSEVKKKTHERFYRRSRTQKKQGASPYNSSNWVRPCEQQQIGQMQNTTRHTDRWTATGDKKVQSNISNFGPWRSGELEIQIWKRNDRHSRQKTVFQGIIKARNSSKTTINRNTNLNHKYCSVLSKDKSTHARRNKRSNRLRRVTSRWQWRK